MRLPWWLSGQETTCQCRMWVRYLGQEEPLEKDMATHSSILTWEILWTEKSSRLESQLSSVRLIHSVMSNSLGPMNRNAAHQASLSITNSQSPPKPMSIESMGSQKSQTWLSNQTTTTISCIIDSFLLSFPFLFPMIQLKSLVLI